MRLYLAIAVLMLALVAYTAAEAQEDTIEQRVAKFTEQVARAGQEINQKFKTSIDEFQTSDFAVSARAQVNDMVEWFKNKFQEIGN